MSNHQEVIDLAKALTGNENLYSVQPFIKIAGDTLRGLFLERIVYWSDKSGNERLRQLKTFYKSAEEWEDELGLSYAQVTLARKKLEGMGFIQISKHKVANAPTLHYCVNMDAIKQAIIAHYQDKTIGYANLEKPEIQETPISENGNLQIEESAQTIEIEESPSSLNNSSNSLNNSNKKKRVVEVVSESDSAFSAVSKIWQSNIGFLSPIIADEIKDVLSEIQPNNQVEWFTQAIGRGCSANARSWRYIKAILLRWIAAGGIDLESRPAEKEHQVSPLPEPELPPPPSPLPLHAQIWQQAQAILQPYAVALTGVEAQPSVNGKFTLTAPKDKKEWIDGRLNDKILQALRQFKPDIQQLEVLTR